MILTNEQRFRQLYEGGEADLTLIVLDDNRLIAYKQRNPSYGCGFYDDTLYRSKSHAMVSESESPFFFVEEPSDGINKSNDSTKVDRGLGWIDFGRRVASRSPKGSLVLTPPPPPPTPKLQVVLEIETELDLFFCMH